MPHAGEFEGIRLRKGVWTPADVSGAGMVLTNLGGVWEIIGDLAWVYYAFTIPGNASGANVTISLPFVCGPKGATGNFVCDDAAAAVASVIAGSASFTMFPLGAFVPIINNTLGGNTFVGTLVYQMAPS